MARGSREIETEDLQEGLSLKAIVRKFHICKESMKWAVGTLSTTRIVTLKFMHNSPTDQGRL